MEKEEKNQSVCKQPETDLFLQWGNRKRLRCARVRDSEISDPSNGGRIRRKIASQIIATASEKESSFLHPSRLSSRNSEETVAATATATATLRKENRKCGSPEKEERYYTTRGSVGDENGKGSMEGVGVGDENRGGVVWPKVFVSLSSKEKEEDFMAMKGCKPPQRPKKRAKLIQRTLLLVSPGAWLSDMCQERYEVREKKSSKKRPRGLKAMGSMESDSE